MKFSSYGKYIARFLFLQILISLITISYFDNFLVSDLACEKCVGGSYAMQIDSNLWEDRNRFFPFLNESLVNLQVFVVIFVFLFLIMLYSTKFYTYVNELSFSFEKNYIDEYVSIYLVWSSSLFIFITLFRIGHLISRGYLLLFTFIIPALLIIFRNSEIISSILGRPVTKENYITFNLDSTSVYRNLRIMTFRKEIGNYENKDFNNESSIIEKIDSVNKEQNVNLIVINLEDNSTMSSNLEEFLINLNKKVLLISKNEIKFKNYFLNRSEKILGSNLIYFNNDIQYGSKFILKRLLDLFISIFAIFIFMPIILFIYIYIFSKDGSEVIIKQNRVGLHGKHFFMYKFRTMYKGSHASRESLKDLNKNDEVIFKIENDPRIIKGVELLRKFSLDELPQFFNVLKGDMSIVGPRPLFDEDTKLFNKNYMRRLNVLPGITGLLQINERNTSEFSTWYKYDIEYIENWSLFLDLKIILKTPVAIFKGNSKGL